MRQLTDTVLMVSPDQFGFNPETAATNVFQSKPGKAVSALLIRDKALAEFRRMVATLRKNGINVFILPSRKDATVPDAVFPNNWFSTHEEGIVVIYPMLAPNRRKERQTLVLKELLNKIGNTHFKIFDFTWGENEGEILEGTGSLVLDRVHKMAWAMESPRTTKKAFEKWCKKMGYKPVFFHAYDKNSLPIYHTNVVMSLGNQFAVACLESINDPAERNMISTKLRESGKEIITITVDQLYAFCANILQLTSKKGGEKIILSNTAFRAFKSFQIKRLQKYGELIAINIPTIERVGGGSARCMMAEVFLPGERN